MERKKLRITIENDETKQVLEANGIAAVLLTDGKDDDHHGIRVCLCGHMGIGDLLHLSDAVEGELAETINQTILHNTPDSLKAAIVDKLIKG